MHVSQNQYWMKRCTVRWTKFGDENTKFFHRMATERRRRNSIASLQQSDGQCGELHEEKAEILFNAYKQILGESAPQRMLFNLAVLIKRVEGLDIPSTPFSQQEIDDALRKSQLIKHLALMVLAVVFLSFVGTLLLRIFIESSGIFRMEKLIYLV